MSLVVVDAYRYVPPVASQFTNIRGTNSELPTLTDTTGRGLVMDFGISPAGGDNVRVATKAKTTLTTTYSIITRLQTTALNFNFYCGGICISDGTKIMTFGIEGIGGQTGIVISQWNSSTSFNNNRFSTGGMLKAFEWYRWDVVAGDPKDFFVSHNGTDWIKILSESQTGFITYSEVGFVSFVNRNSGALPVSGTNQLTASYLYYSDPDIVPAV